MRPLSAALTRRLRRYRRPGNTRGLENVLRRYALLGTEAAMVDTLKFSSPALPGDDLIELNSSGKDIKRRHTKQPETIAILRLCVPDLARSWMVGDRVSDITAGRKAGCHTA